MTAAEKRITAWPGAPDFDVEPSLTYQSSPTYEDSFPVTYHGFMLLDQAGDAHIARDNSKKPHFVAVKRLRAVNQRVKHRIRPFTSDNVVEILDLYFDKDDILIIYEQMDVSLRAITSLQGGPFKSFQIAAVCREVSAYHIVST